MMQGPMMQGPIMLGLSPMMQGPMMQGMMNNYIEQSKNLFVQMQEQMQNQSKSIFGAFPWYSTSGTSG